jgi:hypothetical protein
MLTPRQRRFRPSGSLRGRFMPSLCRCHLHGVVCNAPARARRGEKTPNGEGSTPKLQGARDECPARAARPPAPSASDTPGRARGLLPRPPRKRGRRTGRTRPCVLPGPAPPTRQDPGPDSAPAPIPARPGGRPQVWQGRASKKFTNAGAASRNGCPKIMFYRHKLHVARPLLIVCRSAGAMVFGIQVTESKRSSR